MAEGLCPDMACADARAGDRRPGNGRAEICVHAIDARRLHPVGAPAFTMACLVRVLPCVSGRPRQPGQLDDAARVLRGRRCNGVDGTFEYFCGADEGSPDIPALLAPSIHCHDASTLQSRQATALLGEDPAGNTANSR